MEILTEIITWAAGLPIWQQVAVFKALTEEMLTDEVVGELAQLAIAEQKDAIKLAQATGDPLASFKYQEEQGERGDVVIASITDTKNVNAIKDGNSLTFGLTGLTIVYGNNAVGKSGYTRIFKAACMCRDDEVVRGNISREDVQIPSATITYTGDSGATVTPYDWSQDAAASPDLKTVHIFDSRTARIYLTKENDVQYVPAGLDIFDKLATLFGRVRAELDGERSQLLGRQFDFRPIFDSYPDTEAQRLVGDLSQRDVKARIDAISKLSAEEEKELSAVKKDVANRETNSPVKRKEILRQKHHRYGKLHNLILSYKLAMSAEVLDTVYAAKKELLEATKIAEAAKKKRYSEEHLPGTGGSLWKALWIAAKEYSEKAVDHSHTFPATETGAKCVLCQRELDEPTKSRFKDFQAFMEDTSQQLLNKARQVYDEQLKAFNRIELVTAEDEEVVFAELATDEYTEAAELKQLLAQLKDAHALAAKNFAAPELGEKLSSPAVEYDYLKNLKQHIEDLTKEATNFDIAKFTTELNKSKARVAELEARKLLGKYDAQIGKELSILQDMKYVALAAQSTNTTNVSKKAGELTEKHLVESLKNTFNDELKNIYRDGLKVQLNRSKTRQGTTYSEIVLTTVTAPDGFGLTPEDVMSESEQKVISLAGYFAELSLAPHKSAIVLDDPVTSLDHLNVERIANRIAKEALSRQAIVFTHNVLFATMLIDAAERLGVAVTPRTISKMKHIGSVDEDLPWVVKGVKARVGWLRAKRQDLEAAHRRDETVAYNEGAELFYKRLRETWERAVEERLFADVVKRYSRNVETQKLRLVHVEPTDHQTVADNMGRCSTYVHDSPEADDNTAMPNPEVLTEDLKALEDWVKSLDDRQKAASSSS